MHGCLDNGSLATSSYLRNANIKTYVEECIPKARAAGTLNPNFPFILLPVAEERRH